MIRQALYSPTPVPFLCDAVERSREAPEEPGAILRREALTFVPHRNRESRRFAHDADTDLAALGAVFHRVAQEVHENDPQKAGITLDGSDLVGQAELNVHAPPIDLAAHDVDGRKDQRANHVDFEVGFEHELPAVDPREIEVVLGKLEEVLRLADQSLQFVFLRLIEGSEVPIGEQAGVRDDRGDGVLYLVADKRQHLEVRVVGGRQLLDAPRLLGCLAEALGDSHLQLDMTRSVGANLA